MNLLSSMSETFEIFPWTQQIQKILQNTNGHQALGILIWDQRVSESERKEKLGILIDIEAKVSQRTREEKSWEF